jgi:hypothetical protein
MWRNVPFPFNEELPETTQDVLDTMGIKSRAEGLLNAIASRKAYPTRRSESFKRIEYPRQADISWQGARLSTLSCEGSSTSNEVYFVRATGRLNVLHVEIVDRTHNIIAYAPQSTRVQDWFVIRGTSAGRKKSGLILRSGSGGKLTIVGPAFCASGRRGWDAMSPPPTFKAFKI